MEKNDVATSILQTLEQIETVRIQSVLHALTVALICTVNAYVQNDPNITDKYSALNLFSKLFSIKEKDKLNAIELLLNQKPCLNILFQSFRDIELTLSEDLEVLEILKKVYLEPFLPGILHA